MQKKQTLKKALYRSKFYLQRSSPTILTFVAAVGVVTTSVMAAKATPKAIQLLDSAKQEKREELTTFEIVQIAAPVYIPTALIGLSTIFCIFGANILNKRQQATLISAYSSLKRYHDEYRNKLLELHGEETDIEIRNAMAREHCNYHQINLDIPDGKAIFYDEISGESIVRYEREIMDAEYHLNRNFTMRGYAFLNEFYEFLGLPMTEYGGRWGWSMASGIMWIDFEHRLISDDGKTACYSIDMIFPPDVLEEWEC